MKRIRIDENLYEAANERAEDFINFGLTDYAKLRNFDFGPNDRTNISCLSSFISHRLIFEQELVNHALVKAPFSKIEKFIQEIYWRTYWKGWLELRPEVWDDYARYKENPEIKKNIAEAKNGATGIDCFDAWVKELIEENYLHNHARMWFASIWIFTLKLPWQSGANFFMEHLLDGDAASNTLSWRWVAGLQTKGKHYLAQASNINKFTAKRFDPKNLILDADPLSEKKSYEISTSIKDGNEKNKHKQLLVFENDLWIDGREDLYSKYEDIFVFLIDNNQRNIQLSDKVMNFKNKALEDFAKKFGNAKFVNQEILTSIKGLDVVYPGVGENLDFIFKLKEKNPLSLNFLVRKEDSFCWQFSNKGFFNFKKNIPNIIQKFS